MCASPRSRASTSASVYFCEPGLSTIYNQERNGRTWPDRDPQVTGVCTRLRPTSERGPSQMGGWFQRLAVQAIVTVVLGSVLLIFVSGVGHVSLAAAFQLVSVVLVALCVAAWTYRLKGGPKATPSRGCVAHVAGSLDVVDGRIERALGGIAKHLVRVELGSWIGSTSVSARSLGDRVAVIARPVGSEMNITILP